MAVATRMQDWQRSICRLCRASLRAFCLPDKNAASALARLVAIRTEVWLLDEPSVALDTASLDALRSRIAEHRNSGGMVVASTHAELGFEDAATLDVSAFNGRKAVPI